MYQTMICDKDCLLLVSKDNKILIKQLLKHIEQFNALGYEHIVFCFQSINTEQRKRLLDYKIAYIIPYIQIYLPFIYLNINEKYKKENILELEQSDPVLYKSLVDNQYIVPDDFDEREIVLFRKKRMQFDASMYQVMVNTTLDCNLNNETIKNDN